MIVVDTSVWVAAQRKPAGRDATSLGSLLDADEVLLPLPVRVELLSGIARKDRKAFTRALSALPILVPTEDTWRVVERWVAPASDGGHRKSQPGSQPRLVSSNAMSQPTRFSLPVRLA